MKAGDLVRLVSPASTPDREWVDESVRILESWGFAVDIGAHALDRWGYMAGTDEDRLADLNGAFADPAVRAIVATRGGAGTYRIIDGIDFDAVRADPKPVVGFSDITYLHLALWGRARVPGIHGCLDGERARNSVRHLLTRPEPIVLQGKPLVAGRASGVLLGGNLTSIAGMVGAGLPDLRGAIVAIEAERTIGLGQVDRQLTQLIRSGSFDGIAGIALGRFTKFDNYVDRGWALDDVLTDRLVPLGVPILEGLEFGHGLILWRSGWAATPSSTRPRRH